ncbi:cysteine hydrolase [Butyrivibrio sp. CB08]|uniref:cysteine hydrolase family protein n=1 Tax=Butyrivibrio sp. CB08 TaxID=2364879 RepID=UPI000EAA2CED|nr:cysteine hydrolase family protein [Butyrivibrio sp. CB08]RKM59447.1 cysteine hydrolase [Butyrivibrio sp. CB08]
MILLVVDTQRGCFKDDLYAHDKVVENIKALIKTARDNSIEVAYVQHDDGPGEELCKGSAAYEVVDEFAPLEGERRFEKTVNSAFHDMTGLTDYLRSKNERDIIVTGVCTDYCLDATIKSGFEHGFNIIVPAYANSTYDNPYFDKETAYKFYNEFMWPKRYAKTVTVEETIAMMRQ